MFLIYALARNGRPKQKKKNHQISHNFTHHGVSVGVTSSTIQGFLGQSDPLKVCIGNRNTPYKMSVTLELYVDGNKADIPANIGFEGTIDGLLESDCQHSLYTLTDDGTIYAEWEEEYPFEIGHFLWIWEFPMKDMDESKSRIVMDLSLIHI